jgi:hypothetical protein
MDRMLGAGDWRMH